MVRQYRFIYGIFGSGSRHKPYALFQKISKDFNSGRKIGLIRAAGTRMGGYWYAFHRLLRLRSALQATIHSAEWKEKIILYGKDPKAKKKKIEDLIQDESYFKRIKLIVSVLFPAIFGCYYYRPPRCAACHSPRGSTAQLDNGSTSE